METTTPEAAENERQQPEFDEAMVQVALERFRSQQNLIGGVVAGLVAALVGAAVWAVVTRSPLPSSTARRQIAGRVPRRPVNVFGITFPNELGVAAGFDKNGEAILGFHHLGFGHVEVGTLTPRPTVKSPRSPSGRANVRSKLLTSSTPSTNRARR